MQSTSSQPTRGAATADATASVLPVDAAAEHVDPRVVETLGRWRHVDTQSLHSLAVALSTKTGEPAANNAHYLSALHGFVAERITADHLGVVLPSATNVPGLDLYYHGEAVQIKEGTSAYELVHHALERYPQIRTFATDPTTAERLQAEGISAIPIPGLEPQHIAQVTSDSLTGLGALESAGTITFPLVTTAVAIARYWERFDSERSDGWSALGNAALDVSAQALGSALGLKLAAMSVVAGSSFALAALPLTAGAIAGALGLRILLDDHRERKVAVLLDRLGEVRFASEQAAGIAIELSFEALQRSITAMQPGRITEVDVKLEVVTAYVLLLDHLITIAEPATKALSDVRAEAERLGVNL